MRRVSIAACVTAARALTGAHVRTRHWLEGGLQGEGKERQGKRVTDTQLVNVFSYHRLSDSQVKRCEAIRGEVGAAAMRIQRHCPESREKALALTSLQQAMMWANASIAINENPVEYDPPPAPPLPEPKP
jgi:hypothetical protein